ncbi:hypothetical protein OIO03_25380, partial [Acinetobacter baumannii]|nr:hypothetical protein [Acinetobacter baumannii]MCW1766929.1 hypothetical protein [Acinetobacter baumannii]
QLESLLLYILIIIAVGASLVEKFQNSMDRQAQLVESLARSEHALEGRVRTRTAELLHAQNALQAALQLQDDAGWRAQCLRHAGALKH